MRLIGVCRLLDCRVNGEQVLELKGSGALLRTNLSLNQKTYWHNKKKREKNKNMPFLKSYIERIIS